MCIAHPLVTRACSNVQVVRDPLSTNFHPAAPQPPTPSVISASEEGGEREREAEAEETDGELAALEGVQEGPEEDLGVCA